MCRQYSQKKLETSSGLFITRGCPSYIRSDNGSEFTAKTLRRWLSDLNNGDSSKQISLYSQGRADNLLLSSAGLKINISNFTLNVSLGLDNIGISGSTINGDTTKSFGVKADIVQLKLGFESSTTVKVDYSTDQTTFVNASASG